MERTMDRERGQQRRHPVCRERRAAVHVIMHLSRFSQLRASQCTPYVCTCTCMPKIQGLEGGTKHPQCRLFSQHTHRGSGRHGKLAPDIIMSAAAVFGFILISFLERQSMPNPPHVNLTGYQRRK